MEELCDFGKDLSSYDICSSNISCDSACAQNVFIAVRESEASMLGAITNDKQEGLESVFGLGARELIANALRHPKDVNTSSIINSLGTSIKIVDPITGVKTGAFSSELNAIFLGRDFVCRSSSSLISRVITEEVGHAIDALVNSRDTEGDEGEAFAAYVAGDPLDANSYADEDDSGIINLDGRKITVEYNGSVTLFEHAAYAGRSKTFKIGNHAYVGNDFNDIATSIRMPAGSNLIVEVFEHSNYQGRSSIITYSQASIGANWSDPNWRVSHLNDSVSSMRIRARHANEIVFYQHSNFQGLGHIGFTGNNRTVRFNDDYSSIDLPNGARIDAFEHANYGGRVASYSSDVAFLGVLNDQVSSYQAYAPRSQPQVISAIIDRFRSLDPSKVNDALKLYGIARNSSWILRLTKILKPFLDVVPLANGFNKVRNGDSIGGVIDLVKFVPIPGTSVSWWSLLPLSFRSDVVTGLRAINGEYNNGVRISDLLNS